MAIYDIILLNTEEVNERVALHQFSAFSTLPCWPPHPYSLGAQGFTYICLKIFIENQLKIQLQLVEKSFWGWVWLSKRTYHIYIPFHLFQKKGGDSVQTRRVRVSYFDVKSDRSYSFFPWLHQTECGDSQDKYVNT